jgi:hypothetical protein
MTAVTDLSTVFLREPDCSTRAKPEIELAHTWRHGRLLVPEIAVFWLRLTWGGGLMSVWWPSALGALRRYRRDE